MRAVAARDVAPWGGPAAGGTLLRVHGQSLGDYSGRAGAMRWQGLRCLMGGVAFTPGTRERDGFAMRCHAPDNPYGVAALPTEAAPLFTLGLGLVFAGLGREELRGGPLREALETHLRRRRASVE